MTTWFSSVQTGLHGLLLNSVKLQWAWNQCLLSDCMLISILSVSVEPLEMLCIETVVALAPQAGALKPENLLSPFLLMCVLKKLSLS